MMWGERGGERMAATGWGEYTQDHRNPWIWTNTQNLVHIRKTPTRIFPTTAGKRSSPGLRRRNGQGEKEVRIELLGFFRPNFSIQ